LEIGSFAAAVRVFAAYLFGISVFTLMKNEARESNNFEVKLLRCQ
jgi:hypothetical protein